MSEHKEEKHLYKEPLDFEQRKHHLLACPNCDNFVSADDINIDKTIAKCSSCNHVFNFEHQFEAGRKEFDYGRPEMLIPEGLEVLKLRSELDIQINWFKATSKASFAFTAIFTIIWNLILLPFVVTAIASGAYHILLLTSAHLIVGLSMLYYLVSIFANTTSILVNKRTLEIKTTPLKSPLRKNVKLDIKEIKQLYVSRYVASKTNNKPNFSYALYAITNQNKRVQLLKGMTRETQQYLEQEIEKFLEIKDAKVSGETKR
jgi:predicted Zn finger-like uncharacterized protein